MVLDDGSEVRLIGALAPRAPAGSAGPSAWPPEQAARRALEDLVLGRTVELAFGGRHTDRYGRRLAHAFVERDGKRIWVQGYLLSHGHARAYALPESTACLDEMLAHERVAREGGTGLWAGGAYRIRQAASTGELLARRNSFEIVEGRVANVAEVGRRTYVNFGANWREDFTAVVSAPLGRSSPETRSWLKGLAGQRVRVRGWIERRNGPMIEVADLAQIEVVSGDDPRDPAPPAAGASGELRQPAVRPAPDAKRRPAVVRPGAVDL
jgi:hypothetical protein